MEWVLLTYRLPTEPSRHRVAVWRELRRVGAISLQQATWAAPKRPDFVAAVSRAVDLIERADGVSLIFDAVPQGDVMAARLETLFTQEREQEWQEFLAECDKFDREIEKEIRIKKFTAAELDEEEQNLERLRRWFREIRTRDVFGTPSHHEADRRLKDCAERLEDFAERVYEHGGER
ncbi:MAG: chromate resistance protein ChrB [Actinomycetota bacterium]|nr:chromate resistance protein ChrB [Actinomycetota bacterium]